MQILKALVGGLIGGAVGAVLSNWLQSASPLADPWSLLLVGLGAGLGVRLLCGRDRNFVTGATAAVTAIAAVLGLSFANSIAVLSSAEDTSQPVLVERSDDDIADQGEETDQDEETDQEADDMEVDDADDDEDADESSDESPEESDDSATGGEDDARVDEAAGEEPAGDRSRSPLDAALDQGEVASEPQQVDWGSLEVILQAVSALLAFMLGTGSAKPAAAVGGQPGDADKSEGE